MALSDDRPVILGRVAGPYGVRGWVRVHSFTEPRDAILAYTDWLLEQGGLWDTVRLAEGRPHGKTLIARFEGVDDRDGAAAYVGRRIAVPRTRLPDIGPDEFYWADLEGLAVVDVEGRALGDVAYLMATGANDVLVVRGEREILIPFIRDEVVREVDLAAGVIRVDWTWD